MKKISLTPILTALAALFLIALLVVPTMAAPVSETEFVINDTRYEFDKQNYVDGENSIGANAPFKIRFTNYQDLANVQTVFWKPFENCTNFELYNESIRTETYNVLFINYPTDSVIGSGILTYYKGDTTAQSYVRVDFHNIDTSLLTNIYVNIIINDDKPYNLHYVYGRDFSDDVINGVYSPSGNHLLGLAEIEYFTRFTHTIILEDYNENSYNINIDRNGTKMGSDYGKHSTVSIHDNSGNLLYTNTSSLSVTATVNKSLQPYTVIVESTAFDKTYTGYLGTGEPWTPGGEDPTPATPVTVYARNSQTGALLADAHILISANVNGEFHEVINQTLPSGLYTGNLQPTGGGFPNPDFYRLITTAEDYISVIPYIDFEVDGVTTIYAYLEPVGGAPEDENNTFIDFYVRDLAANAISGATVNFGGQTLITNSAGYAVLEVGKNATYSWTVSKSGYGPLTGNAVIGSNARYTINAVIAPAITPTTPTPIPTDTPISPTPTLTAPTGEPVSNWLEWFAAHFGMILGGGVEIGKIFMWLCFTLPAGVYVGKEAKAGAAGFMAGAGIVTLFFVLIGWVPLWLVVLLALIIGLLYAKVFNNSDHGGGR